MTRTTPDITRGPLARQAQWLERYRPTLRISERGSVISVGDGIAKIAGLPSAAMDDLLVFEDGSRAMVFDLTETLIGKITQAEDPIDSTNGRVFVEIFSELGNKYIHAPSQEVIIISPDLL